MALFTLRANTGTNFALRAMLSTSSSRATVQVHPVTGEKPPTLEEFDPLNPGNWQIGVAGKILPRLPEGTKCGKLVMGKYGLYDPKQKKFAEYMNRCHAAGIATEDSMMWQRRLKYVLMFLTVAMLPITAFNAYCMVHGRLFWPYTIWLTQTGEWKE